VDPLVINGLLMIVVGVLVLWIGSRLVVLGAGIGLLLGVGILSLLPGPQGPLLAIGIPVALAVIFALGGGFAKGMIGLITMAVGALAGAAIVLAVLNMFNLSLGVGLELLLLVVGAVVGVVLVGRFKDLAVLILAGLVGAFLVTRGLQVWLPSFTQPLSSIVVLVLAVAGVAYQGGYVGGKKQVTQT
jgi:hypothetical protein